MALRRLVAAMTLVLALSLFGTGAAYAADSVGLPLSAPASDVTPPPGFTTNARQALAIAEATPTVRKLAREHPDLTSHVYIWSNYRWEVDFGSARKDLAEVDVSSAGAVTAVWNGPAVDAYYARGHYSHTFDSPWVLLPFALLFLLPFVNLRRPFRLAHLDALALLAFSASYIVFTHGSGNLTLAVPLVYPVLGYLLVRMLVVGLGRKRAGRAGEDRRGSLLSRVPIALLVVGLIALVGARIALNISARESIDVSYASVVGADRIWHGQVLYVNHSVHGDTYGPITYLAYVPFERMFPWHGNWDFLPAAHAATIFFDLMTILGLFLLGRQMRAGPEGRRLGLMLGWAWAAYPFTLLGVIKNTNDGLVAMLLVFALLALRRPAGRGAVLGLAAAAKFFPAAMLPLFATGTGERSLKRAALCAAGFVAVVVFAIALYLPPEGIGKFYDATLGYQFHRSDLFSLWGLHPPLTWLQTAAEVVAIGIALVVGFARRERSVAQVSACAAAVAIAIQLPATHWFYYYIVWFFPLVLVALFAPEPVAAASDPVTLDADVAAHAPAAREREAVLA